MAKAVFLDRDGVLIHSKVRGGKPYAIVEGETAVLLPGVEAACHRLKQAGYLLVMVTNQPDVVRGKTERRFVEVTNALLTEQLGLDAVEVCYHDDSDECLCRKPQPGMLTGAAARLAIDLAQSWMIGDRWRDIEAGRAAGCRTAHIDCGYQEQQAVGADLVRASLAEAAEAILAGHRPPT